MLVNVNSALKRDEIRKVQKGLICVDRTVGGAYENYVTVAVGDLDNLVVGDRYSFTVTGRVEGFTINESFEVVCN